MTDDDLALLVRDELHALYPLGHEAVPALRPTRRSSRRVLAVAAAVAAVVLVAASVLALRMNTRAAPDAPVPARYLGPVTERTVYFSTYTLDPPHAEPAVSWQAAYATACATWTCASLSSQPAMISLGLLSSPTPARINPDGSLTPDNVDRLAYAVVLVDIDCRVLLKAEPPGTPRPVNQCEWLTLIDATTGAGLFTVAGRP